MTVVLKTIINTSSKFLDLFQNLIHIWWFTIWFQTILGSVQRVYKRREEAISEVHYGHWQMSSWGFVWTQVDHCSKRTRYRKVSSRLQRETPKTCLFELVYFFFKITHCSHLFQCALITRVFKQTKAQRETFKSNSIFKRFRFELDSVRLFVHFIFLTLLLFLHL